MIVKDGKQMSCSLKPRRSFVSLESHLFRQSRLQRLGPLGNEEVISLYLAA